jgi:uncharacterized FAD-dependent dehydrogenase
MRTFIVKYDVNKDQIEIFLKKITTRGEIGGVAISFLVATNMGIAIAEGDHFVAEFEIGKKI